MEVSIFFLSNDSGQICTQRGCSQGQRGVWSCTQDAQTVTDGRTHHHSRSGDFEAGRRHHQLGSTRIKSQNSGATFKNSIMNTLNNLFLEKATLSVLCAYKNSNKCIIHRAKSPSPRPVSYCWSPVRSSVWAAKWPD